MKKVVKFKEGESIPDGAVFLKSEDIRNREYSNWTWCNCHDLLNCECYHEEKHKVFYYEITE